MPSVIHTEQLTKRYRRVTALDHVTLDVTEGSVYALVGQNGAGKTTAIKILMNLISATEGTANIFGKACTQIRGKAYAQIGYVSENQEIPEWMKVGYLLEYLREFYLTWDRALEQSLIKQFELPLDRKIKALSRGMKMKLALASALAISIKPIAPSNEIKDFSGDSSREIQLSIPPTVSGVAAGTAIQLNAVNIYAESPEKSSWSGGWLHESATIWPEDQLKMLSYSVDRTEYEKFKDTPLHLQINLAISEYQTVGSRSLKIASRGFLIQLWGPVASHC